MGRLLTVKHYEGWFNRYRGALLVEASRVARRGG